MTAIESKEENKIHELKTWPEYFKEIKSGQKTFEIRKDDRDFQVGDTLLLKEFRPTGYSSVNPNERMGQYTGNELSATVTYIFDTSAHSNSFGLMSGYCVMGIALSSPPVQDKCH